MNEWPTLPAGAGYPLVDAATGAFLGSKIKGNLDAAYVPKPGDIFATAAAGDASAYLNGLLAQAAVSRANVLLMPGTYVVNSTITIDVTKHGFFAPYGGVTIDQRGLPADGVGMKILASKALPSTTPNPYGIQFGAFQMFGPGKATASTGILFATSTATVSADLRGVQVRRYGTGHDYGDNAYIVNHFGGNITDCTIGVHTRADTVNGGERLTYFGFTLNSCTVAVQNDAPNAEFYFIGCSLDYNTQVYKATVGNLSIFRDCHHEMDITVATTPYQVSGNASLLVEGGKLIQTGTYAAGTAKAAMVQNDNDATLGALVAFNDLWMNNLRTTTDMFAAGGGATQVNGRIVSGGTSATFTVVGTASNLLARGDFETATVEDNWSITGDTAAIVNATAGANISFSQSNIAPRSGARSMHFSKVGGVGTAAKVAVLVPIRPGAIAGFLGWFKKNAGVTGGATAILYYCRPKSSAPPFSIGPSAQASLSAAALDLTGGFADWTSWSSGRGSSRRAPLWATHVALVIDMTAMSAGSLFLDDLVVTDS